MSLNCISTTTDHLKANGNCWLWSKIEISRKSLVSSALYQNSLLNPFAKPRIWVCGSILLHRRLSSLLCCCLLLVSFHPHSIFKHGTISTLAPPSHNHHFRHLRCGHYCCPDCWSCFGRRNRKCTFKRRIDFLDFYRRQQYSIGRSGCSSRPPAVEHLASSLCAQCASFLTFLVILGLTIFRIRSHSKTSKVVKGLWILLATSLLLFTRTVFRLAETAEGLHLFQL